MYARPCGPPFGGAGAVSQRQRSTRRARGETGAGVPHRDSAVLASSRSGPEEHVRYRVSDHGAAAAPPAAFGGALMAPAFVHGLWMLALAVPLLGVAVVMAVRGTTPREE
jgi:hypothetical protein